MFLWYNLFMSDRKPYIIATIILLALLVFFYLRFSPLRKSTSNETSQPVVFTVSPYPSWIPKPGIKKPVVVYDSLPFKKTDKTRKVNLIGCVIDDSDWGMSYPKKTVEVANVSTIASATMNAFLEEAAISGWGGFPTKDEVKRFLNKPGEVFLKNLTIDKYGTARVYFSKEIKAFGGGSSRVVCMQDSVEFTLKQFPEIKSVVLCIEDTCADQKGSSLFQP